MKKTLLTLLKTKEVNNMRKTLIVVALAFLSVMLVSMNADALVSGKCGDCHTMHNSQNGSAVDASGPNDNLTKYDCIGCHSGALTAAPDVTGTSSRTAGGTFDATVVDAAATDYHKVHNVRDISWTNDESELMSTIPGKELPDAGFVEPAGAAELTCATALGCHGQASGGFKGFHHGQYPNAYRFLRFYDGTSTYTDIKGKGSSDWEKGGATASNHNVYYADDSSPTNTISLLCSMCHGEFHGTDDTQSSSPFKRHPTENLIPSSWDQPSPKDITVDYNNNPLAFTGGDYDGVATGSAYDMTDAPRVACVSCHRAHGTDYDDILRFDYTSATTGQKAGSGDTNSVGCLGCHTNQR